MSERKSEGSVLGEVLRTAIPYVLRAVTPLHPGSGAKVSGIVDLAIQREAHTDLPVIYGSSIKGALRAWAQISGRIGEKRIREIFGPPPGEGSEGMGKAVFMDAKLLLMPVRTLKGTYGWITSPFIVNRFFEDMEIVQRLLEPEKGGRGATNPLRRIEGEPAPGRAWLRTRAGPLTLKIGDREIVVIEDIKLEVEERPEYFEFLNLLDGTLRKRLEDRIAIVNHDTFRRVLERALMISPHIAIKPDTGTVANLWFQEDLPPETILYSTVFTTKDLRSDLENLLQGVVHVGGDVTIGLGFAEVRKIEPAGGGKQ